MTKTILAIDTLEAREVPATFSVSSSYASVAAASFAAPSVSSILSPVFVGTGSAGKTGILLPALKTPSFGVAPSAVPLNGILFPVF